MRVVFISLYKAYPPTNGAGAVTFNCARHAPGQAILLQLSPDDPPGEQTVDDVRIIHLPGLHGKLRRFFTLPRLLRDLARRCRDLSPELIVLEGANWVAYLWLIHRYLRRLGITAPVAYHAHNVEALLRRQQYGPAIGWISRLAESRLARTVQHVFAVSEIDRQHIKRLYAIRAHLLSNGVDAERFEQVTPDQIGQLRRKYALGDQTALFMGPYYYPPNRQAVDFLVNEVFPAVLAQHPQARLIVLGSPIPYVRPWLTAPGSVPSDEVAVFVRACQIGLAPIFSGGGTRLKILEYLAGRLPTISTPKGAEGLDLHDSHHILHAHTAEQFVTQVGRLFNNPSLARTLAAAGRQQVCRLYTWPAIMQRFADVVRSDNSRRAEVQPI